MIDNKVVIVSNYTTDALQETLSRYAKMRYKLVSTEIAKNQHGIIVMYLFFVKETN
jgi:hypothetical protein